MKNIIKFIPFILIIFLSLDVSYSYYNNTSSIPNIFKTESYTFILNGMGGSFDDDNNVIVEDNQTILPIPKRNGYTFLGYSNVSNGSVLYSDNISDVSQINNKEIYAIWDAIKYSISYDLDGGTIDNIKNNYNSDEEFTLQTPYKKGYTFAGWQDSNGNVYASVTIPKGTTGNLSYKALWSVNSYTVDVNPVIDGTTYNCGLSGYTFDVYINGSLVADDVIDWCQSVSYGSTVRVIANGLTGRSTSYDETFTVGTSSLDIRPSWTINTYQAHFYHNGTVYAITYNKYGSYISTPSLSAGDLGYNTYFYYISGYSPWTSWYQPEYAVGFNIDIAEYYCYATFGSAGSSNSNAQKTKLANAGYTNCYVSGSMLVCDGTYSTVLNVYNNAWNVLPRSGSGYSRYKSMECDATGYGVEAKR